MNVVVQILFSLFAVTACLGAVMVVVTQSVVRMAIWLVFSLGSVAALFFLLSADFVAATQLLIYVGGTVVLLIFGVMLTASGPYQRIATSPGSAVLAGAVAILFLVMLASTVLAVDWDDAIRIAGGADAPQAAGYNDAEVGNTMRPLGLSLLGLRPDRDLGAESGETSPGYLLPFEIASVHLLVVLIGAAYLARAKRRVSIVDED